MKRRKAGGSGAHPQTAPLVRASISFPPDLYESLEGIASQKKVSLAWVVRDASEKYICGRGDRRKGRSTTARAPEQEMKLIKNTGSDRVIDELRRTLAPPSSLDLASPAFSLFAFEELRDLLEKLDACRMVLPAINGSDLGLTGSDADRAFRNRLQLRWLARECGAWIKKKVELRGAPALLPQSILIAGKPESQLHRVITGNCAFTTEGLGVTPGNQFGLIQCSEKPEESAILGSWFASLWNTLPASDQQKAAFLSRLQELADPKAPSLVYYLTLFHIFRDLGDELDEERIVKSATGIRNTTVWKKLYKFQRDGVIGAIDKLERLGGCIIADSVGLGKTFEALAIIKYYELRNDRVLVLVPKRLRDNWTLYKANDRRNFLATDRFSYDVLNHTDLSRDGGTSGDIDLANVNWGNYDLVVIDESHNFRNKATHNTRETRYDPIDAPHHQGRREDPGADALGHAGKQPPRGPQEPNRLRDRRRRHGVGRARDP